MLAVRNNVDLLHAKRVRLVVRDNDRRQCRDSNRRRYGTGRKHVHVPPGERGVPLELPTGRRCLDLGGPYACDTTSLGLESTNDHVDSPRRGGSTTRSCAAQRRICEVRRRAEHRRERVRAAARAMKSRCEAADEPEGRTLVSTPMPLAEAPLRSLSASIRARSSLMRSSWPAPSAGAPKNGRRATRARRGTAG